MKAYKTLPKFVKIGQREFKIIIRETKSDPTLEGEAFGYTLPGSDQIILRDDMSLGNFRRVLMHEILHAITIVNGNQYTHDVLKENKTATNEDWEHYYIGKWEEGLVCLLRENPDLIKFLAE